MKLRDLANRGEQWLRLVGANPAASTCSREDDRGDLAALVDTHCHDPFSRAGQRPSVTIPLPDRFTAALCAGLSRASRA